MGYPTSSGLIVTLPGILLQGIHEYKQDFRFGHTHEIIFIKEAEENFFVYGLLTKSIIWGDYAGTDLALVMSGQLDVRGTFSAFVQVQDRSDAMISCRFLACAMIMGNAKAYRNLDATIFTRTQQTQASQKWCVG